MDCSCLLRSVDRPRRINCMFCNLLLCIGKAASTANAISDCHPDANCILAMVHQELATFEIDDFLLRREP